MVMIQDVPGVLFVNADNPAYRAMFTGALAPPHLACH